jgi:hypothetical protein
MITVYQKCEPEGSVDFLAGSNLDHRKGLKSMTKADSVHSTPRICSPIAPEAEQATAGGTSPAAEAVDKGGGLRSALTTRLSPLNSTQRVFLLLLRGAASFGPHVSN